MLNCKFIIHKILMPLLSKYGECKTTNTARNRRQHMYTSNGNGKDERGDGSSNKKQDEYLNKSYQFIQFANVKYSVVKRKFPHYLLTLHNCIYHGFNIKNINFDIVNQNGNSYCVLYQAYKYQTKIEKQALLDKFTQNKIDIGKVEKEIDSFIGSLQSYRKEINDIKGKLRKAGVQLLDPRERSRRRRTIMLYNISSFLFFIFFDHRFVFFYQIVYKNRKLKDEKQKRW